jgi:uncharacterized membrane protein YhhN
MATVLSDAYVFIPAVLVAGVLADAIAWTLPPGRSRFGDGLVAFLVPALFFGCYFATIAINDGLGWSLHMWLGAIPLAGIVGLFIDELSRRPSAAR